LKEEKKNKGCGVAGRLFEKNKRRVLAK